MKKKIAFDFDGVIADTESKKFKWVKENIGIKIKSANKSSFYAELSNYYTKNQIDIYYKIMSKEIFNDKTLFETKAISGAVRSLKFLSENFEIYIITARPNYMFYSIKKWLTQNEINKCIKKIISSSYIKKQDICIENGIVFLCDDDIRHLEENKITNRVYFSIQSDQQIESRVKIVNNWDEITSILIKGE